MASLASEELQDWQTRLREITSAIEEAYRSVDERDVRNAVIEIRAGAGGDESAIFVADLYRAYAHFLEDQGYKLDIVSANGDVRSFKEMIFSVEGEGAYGLLKHEAGVHRVQRVPATGTRGRILTSTISVTVFLEAQPVDIDIPESEIKVDVFRSSGVGGQNVQKNATAIHITHIPTGLVVSCQDERSQAQNRLRAMNVLRARLYEREVQWAKAEEAAGRHEQVSSADRSEKIRTYNFPQSRITDHHTGDETHNLEGFFAGDIGEFIGTVGAHLNSPELTV